MGEDSPVTPPQDADPHGVTSFHVRQAVKGSLESVEWIVRRLSPLLLAQVSYRVKRIQGFMDPEDLVQDAWLRTLPRLEDLRPREGRITPVLLRFLTTVVNRRVRDVLERVAGSAPHPEGSDSGPDLAVDESSVVTRVVQNEAKDSVWDALQKLGQDDRDVVILRGIEQNPLDAVAAVVRSTPEAVRKRYHRALARLRSLLPASVFLELPDGE